MSAAGRLGADACPGIDERGHGLAAETIHAAGCCAEWASGQASSPARTEAFRDAAARWGSAWPKPAPECEPEPETEL